MGMGSAWLRYGWPAAYCSTHGGCSEGPPQVHASFLLRSSLTNKRATDVCPHQSTDPTRSSSREFKANSKRRDTLLTSHKRYEPHSLVSPPLSHPHAKTTARSPIISRTGTSAVPLIPPQTRRESYNIPSYCSSWFYFPVPVSGERFGPLKYPHRLIGLGNMGASLIELWVEKEPGGSQESGTIRRSVSTAY